MQEIFITSHQSTVSLKWVSECQEHVPSDCLLMLWTKSPHQKKHHYDHRLMLNAYLTPDHVSLCGKGWQGYCWISQKRSSVGRGRSLLSQSEQQLLKRIRWNKTPPASQSVTQSSLIPLGRPDGETETFYEPWAFWAQPANSVES